MAAAADVDGEAYIESMTHWQLRIFYIDAYIYILYRCIYICKIYNIYIYIYIYDTIQYNTINKH